MAARLINGNKFDDVTAQVDADFYGGLTGGITGIMQIGRGMAAEIINNIPRVYDGVILTKEGRRIQIDYDDYVDFTIPAGEANTTAYYIIGFKLKLRYLRNQRGPVCLRPKPFGRMKFCRLRSDQTSLCLMYNQDIK